MKYEYTLDADGSILGDIIKMDDTLRPLIQNIKVTRNIDNTFPENNVEITANIVLNSDQEDVLIGVINNYATHPYKTRKTIEDTVMNPAMAFGMDFLKKFSSNNLYLQKTDEQIGALLDTYPSLVIACITGSLKALNFTIMGMTANENISQEEIDEFKKRVQLYLGII